MNSSWLSISLLVRIFILFNRMQPAKMHALLSVGCYGIYSMRKSKNNVYGLTISNIHWSSANAKPVSSELLFRFYSLSSDAKDVTRSLILLDPSSDYGIITKISCAFDTHKLKLIACAAVSTTGTLHLWKNFVSCDKNDVHVTEVEKCGLSALDICSENG